MKLVSYFALSLAIHVSALIYPVSFSGRTQVELIPVTILPLEHESPGSSSGSTGSENLKSQSGSNDPQRKQPLLQRAIEAQPKTNSAPQTTAAESPDIIGEGGIPRVTAAQSHSASSPHPTSNNGDGSGNDLGGTGNGYGSAGTGFGLGSGNPAGSYQTGIALTQARVRDTPRPEYPENARREGREGRVLLRVLVDDQGRSKLVEINSSSGSDALDRAAAEAIKHWRFHPARQGDQPIESWLRIPIEFRLANAKSQ